MPIGKDIYDMMSKKFREKREAVERDGPEVPPEVHQYKKNNATRSKSSNIQIANLAEPRNISPTEGMPAINGESGEKIVKKAVRKIPTKEKKIDQTAGVIENSGDRQKKCGLCRKPGHTRRSCPNKD